jgi:hypothetical protein
MPKIQPARQRSLARLLFCCALLSPAFGHAADLPPTPEMLEKIRVANDECFSCHSETGLKKPPKAGMDLVKLKDMLIDAAALKASDHDQMACTKCHKKGYKDHPHDDDARESLAECQECHAKKAIRIERQFDKSVHAENLADKMTCAKCHDAHVMRIAAKLGDPRKIVAQDNKACLKCHDSDVAFADMAPEVPETKLKKKRPPIDKIHEWLPNTQLHWQAVRCVECHTPPDEKILSHEILNKKKAEKKCVTCHSANTALQTRLYRHLAAEEQNKFGFLNSVVLRDSYVVGATRNPTLDLVLIGLIGTIFGGVVVHGVIRLLLSLRRKRHD